MAYPATAPSYTVTSGTEKLGLAASGLGLSALLNLFEGDITGLATKLGTGASTPLTDSVLGSTSTGTSGWLTSLSNITFVTPVMSTIKVNGGANTLTLPTSTDTLVGRDTNDTLTNKTLTTPTIASFTNAQHNHSNAAGGGQISTSGVATGAITNTQLNLSGSQTATVSTSQGTTSTSPTDLATAGPTVTVTVGASGLAIMSIFCTSFTNIVGAANAFMTVAISGATTRAANVNVDCFGPASYGSGIGTAGGITVVVSGLNTGSTTFTCKYSTTSGTATFANRELTVVPI